MTSDWLHQVRQKNNCPLEAGLDVNITESYDISKSHVGNEFEH